MCYNYSNRTIIQQGRFDMRLVIEDILIRYYDELKRDSFGTIAYDNRLKQVADNLLVHDSMNTNGFSTYDEFGYALINDTHKFSYTIQSLPKGSKTGYRYVNDILIKEIWKSWLPHHWIFLSAGTGRGKNTFIKKELLRYCENQKVIIFENRESLMNQQVQDIVSEIDPDALKYQDISNENMVIFGSYKNIMLISYQTAALKCMFGDRDFMNFCLQTRYIVFDEAHYILDDAPFNKGINFFINTFFCGNKFPNSTKIFMSGSIEEFFCFIQKYNPSVNKIQDILKEKEAIDNGSVAHNLLRQQQKQSNNFYAMSLPTDYSYINPYKYKNLDDICTRISETDPNDKWLIFVNSLQHGMELLSNLRNICGDKEVQFLYSKNKKDDENEKLYRELVCHNRFGCRVLIATTVIYNGVNIKDSLVKHIVIPFITIPVVKQLIGRKRMMDNKTVNVYFPDVPYKTIKKRYHNCIKDYMEIIGLNINLLPTAAVQLNHLMDGDISKYYYLSSVLTTSQQSNCLQPMLNFPAMEKLYFDTCFYIFALHRMNPELENPSDFVKILLTHLDIENKYSDVVNISIQTKEEKENYAIKELADCLASLTDTSIVVPDNNGSYEEFLKLKEIINHTYKNLHGENFDTQWKNKERFFSEEKIKNFLAEINLSYEIKSEGSKSKRTITIKKIMG